MSKGSKHTATSQPKGQGGSPTIGSVVAAGFGALTVLSLLSPVDSVSVFLGTALPQNLGWLLLAVLVAFANRGAFPRISPSRTEIVLISGGLGWLIVVTVLDSRHGNGRAVWNGFWQVVSLASCFYIGRALFQFSQVRKTLVLVLLVGCTAMSFVGLEQVLISMPASRAKYAEDPERVLAEYGIDAPLGSPRRAQFEDRLNSPEPFANFALANSLASLLCVGAMLTSGALLSLIQRDAKATKNASLKWVGVTGLSIALLTQLICLLLTRSRTAYLSIAVAVGLWLALEWTRGKVQLTGRALRMAGLTLGALAMAGFGWLLTVDKLVWSEASKSISYRLEYWQATLTMIRDHVWTGVGLGNFQAYYPRYKLEQASEVIADPHNWILDIAATLSVPIAVLVMGWIGFAVAKGIGACWGRTANMNGGANADANAPSANAREVAMHEQTGRSLARGLIVGAVIGGGLSAALLGLAGGLDLPTNGIAWGISAGLGWLAWRSGATETTAANLVAAIVAVVLCLLSSGSWQASGIAIPLMSLLAIQWQANPWQANEGMLAGTERRGAIRWVAPIVASLGLAIFVLQTWRPVMQSWMLAESAAAAASNEERIRLFEQAVEADPLDLERSMHKVQLLALKANESTSDAAFSSGAAGVLQELQRISPPEVVSFLIPKLAGEISLQLAANAARRGLPNQEFIAAAGGFYSSAVERYPSSVELHVQFAAALALAEDWPSAAKSLEKACEISDRTPHLDKKLPAQMILLPLKPDGFESPSDYVPAEPLVNWLRKEIEAKLR
ncbi:MAG: O-antigen ligase family protein [Pirellulaceae bacterium]|nr:O-antigen ligase family protein [Pirellulaceae bacterium]